MSGLRFGYKKEVTSYSDMDDDEKKMATEHIEETLDDSDSDVELAVISEDESDG